MRYRNACLTCYYKIYIVYRDFITTVVIGILNYTIIQNYTILSSHLAGLLLVRYRIVWPILHGLRLFLFILQEVHCFNMMMHYTHGGTISLYQISCLNMLPLVSYAF